MIKINLLPSYVLERAAVRRLMMIFVVLLAVIIAGGLAYRLQRGAKLSSLQSDLTNVRITETEVLRLEQQATQETAKIDPMNQKLQFIDGVMAYNRIAPDLYEQLGRFTYEKVRYREITLTDTQMEITAYAPSISDAGRYLLNLYRATNIFSQVSMSSVPGFGSGEGGGTSGKPPKGFDFKVTCALAKPISAPTYGGAAGAAPGTTPTGTYSAPAVSTPGTSATPPPPPPTAGGGAPSEEMRKKWGPGT